jgi:hypothetical protein
MKTAVSSNGSKERLYENGGNERKDIYLFTAYLTALLVVQNIEWKDGQ